MSEITKEDKRRIAARLFFNDNKDQYEDYHEALSEFISGQNQSDDFIDFVVEPLLKGEPGHHLFTKDGHVAKLRIEDDFFSPLTEMSEFDGESFETSFDAVADKNPNTSVSGILELLGWKRLEVPSE